MKRLYDIVECFGPDSGDTWTNYLSWRGLEFEAFHSIDGMLRPSIWGDPRDEDWKFITTEPNKLNYFTDLERARSRYQELQEGDLICVSFDAPEDRAEILGFDILDGATDISLLTNWGNDTEFVNAALNRVGLVDTYETALEIQKTLFSESGSDPHVEGCQIVTLLKCD